MMRSGVLSCASTHDSFTCVCTKRLAWLLRSAGQLIAIVLADAHVVVFSQSRRQGEFGPIISLLGAKCVTVVASTWQHETTETVVAFAPLSPSPHATWQGLG